MQIRLPPPVIFIFCALIMWLMPTFYSFPRYPWLVGVLVGMSGILAWASLWGFWQAKTSLDPIRLEKTRTLVVSGIYQFSRNPMYLSLALLLLAWGCWLGSTSAVLFLFVFVFCMTQFQIKAEETHLEKVFGEAYLAYKQKVRRWL